MLQDFNNIRYFETNLTQTLIETLLISKIKNNDYLIIIENIM